MPMEPQHQLTDTQAITLLEVIFGTSLTTHGAVVNVRNALTP